jgi:hypothetical protein
MPGGGESGSAPEGFALLFLQNLPGFPPKDLQVGGRNMDSWFPGTNSNLTPCVAISPQPSDLSRPGNCGSSLARKILPG